MKKELQNLKQRSRLLFTRSIRLEDGGKTDLYLISSVFYSILFLFNFVDQILKGQSIIERMGFTLPFLLLAVLFSTKYKKTVNFLLDAALCLIMITISNIGEFSGVSFLYLVLFRINKKSTLYIIIALSFISIGASSIIYSRTIPEVFVILGLNIFMGAKYYYDIFLVIQRMKQKIKDLEDKLSLFGPREILTDDQILLKYSFLNHSGDNPYRKIQDLRLLVDNEIKEIASINGVSPNTINREFDNIKKNIGFILDKEIHSLRSLIKSCIELGIIEINFIHH